ncbi:hypothetical protein M5K25_012067 [Dendrobium thyrsiflorum]|uniref:Uncharacterized protein n=1 Tax=Dendrobium thyrsiflorum TaxID=117978 RepID=A0ABD0UW29_DENTH
MNPNQGPEALLEGSNHNLDCQTAFKLDKLIVESSGSTRRIQRAQEHRIPTSLRTLSKKQEARREEEKGGRKKLLLDHRRSSAGPPPDVGVLLDRNLTPEFRQTATRRRGSAGVPPLDAGVATDCRLKLDFSL